MPMADLRKDRESNIFRNHLFLPSWLPFTFFLMTASSLCPLTASPKIYLILSRSPPPPLSTPFLRS